MKKSLWAALLGLSFLLMPAGARAGCFTTTVCCSPVHVAWNANCCLKVSGCPVPQAGPWYLYWPLEAHFGPPAPTGYPYWPPPMTLPGQPAPYGPPPPLGAAVPYGAAYGAAPAAPAAPAFTPPPPTPVQQTGFQPVGYYPQQVPSYWYGR